MGGLPHKPPGTPSRESAPCLRPAGTFINNGILSANTRRNTLTLTGTFTNNGSFIATNGGTFQATGAMLTNYLR